MATSPDTIETTDRRRGLTPAQIALAVGGVLLALLLAWFFLLRSDGEDPAVAEAPVPVVEEEPEEAAAPPTKKEPVETFEVFAPKDPFDPLISAATEGGGTEGTTVAGGTGATEGASTTDGTTTTSSGTTTTTTTTGGGGGGGEDIGGHRVRVIDVFEEGGERRAQVQVDGTVYTVDEGERFADNFELLSTSGQCATMLFGDDEFTLCEGEEILK